MPARWPAKAQPAKQTHQNIPVKVRVVRVLQLKVARNPIQIRVSEIFAAGQPMKKKKG